MNPFLAELYNTAENIGVTKEAASDENEKLAQAYVLDQMLQNEGYSLDKLSADDVVKVATEIFGADSPLVKEAMGDGSCPPGVPPKKKEDKKDEEEKEKEAQEKLAEADFLGRAMAHAYVDELRGIEKKAQEEQTQTQAGLPPSMASLLNKQASEQQSPSSALDILAQNRAQEILKQAQANQDQGDAQQKLAQAVEARALEYLKAQGYNVG